jgi:hypothetical protein
VVFGVNENKEIKIGIKTLKNLQVRTIRFKVRESKIRE